METVEIIKSPKLSNNWPAEDENFDSNIIYEPHSETILCEEDNDEPPPYDSEMSNSSPWSHVFSSSVQCCDNITHFEPLALYTMLKWKTPQLLRASSESVDSEDSDKVNVVTAKKYGVIFIGCVVVVSLMALSLLVRCVVEKSFWQS